MASAASTTPTRQRIIEAAKGRFTANGIRGTSIEQIADAAGVHRVTVHRVFAGGRDELVAEVLVARALEALELALPSADDTRPASELLVEAFTSFVLLARTDPVIYEGVCSDAAGLALVPERLAQIYDMTIAWGVRIAPTAALDEVEFLNEPKRVTDLLARTVLTLVREPGIVETEEDVRAFLTDFVIPAITRPVADRPG